MSILAVKLAALGWTLRSGGAEGADRAFELGVDQWFLGNHKTKVPKEAFRVWEWYMGGEYGLERARTGWGIPPLLSLRKLLPEDNAYNKSRKAVAFDDAKYFVSWQASPYITDTPFNTAYGKHIDDLVKGTITADKFVDLMFADINVDLKAGREELGE